MIGSPSTDLEVGALTQDIVADIQVVLGRRLSSFTLGLSVRRGHAKLTGLGE